MNCSFDNRPFFRIILMTCLFSHCSRDEGFGSSTCAILLGSRWIPPTRVILSPSPPSPDSASACCCARRSSSKMELLAMSPALPSSSGGCTLPGCVSCGLLRRYSSRTGFDPDELPSLLEFDAAVLRWYCVMGVRRGALARPAFSRLALSRYMVGSIMRNAHLMGRRHDGADRAMAEQWM